MAGIVPVRGQAAPHDRRRVSSSLVTVNSGLNVCSSPARDSCTVLGPRAPVGSPTSSHTEPQPALRAEPSQEAKLPL